MSYFLHPFSKKSLLLFHTQKKLYCCRNEMRHNNNNNKNNTFRALISLSVGCAAEETKRTKRRQFKDPRASCLLIQEGGVVPHQERAGDTHRREFWKENPCVWTVVEFWCRYIQTWVLKTKALCGNCCWIYRGFLMFRSLGGILTVLKRSTKFAFDVRV